MSAPATPLASGLPAPVTLNETGKPQSVTVPAGIYAVQVNAVGGGGGAVSGGSAGGAGAVVAGTLAVTPGELLTVNVGQQGHYGTNNDWSNGGTGGWGATMGGGNGGTTVQYLGGGGGGATSIMQGTQVLVVAGGGGGAGDQGDESNGGVGGSAGGTAGNGGKGGGDWPGNPGTGGGASTGQGTQGGGDSSVDDGGGGGGGVQGGTGGGHSNYSGGGGGGAGTSSSGSMTSAAITTDSTSENGQVTLTWPVIPASVQQVSGWGASVGQCYTFPPVVAQVTDGAGQPLPGVPVTFLTGDPAIAQFSGATQAWETVTTNAQGQATVSDYTANDAGRVQLTAQTPDGWGGGTGSVSTSATFTSVVDSFC